MLYNIQLPEIVFIMFFLSIYISIALYYSVRFVKTKSVRYVIGAIVMFAVSTLIIVRMLLPILEAWKT